MDDIIITTKELEDALIASANWLATRSAPCGQMMTTWKCLGCGNQFIHGCTYTPALCKTCLIIIRQAARGLSHGMAERAVLPFKIVKG